MEDKQPKKAGELKSEKQVAFPVRSAQWIPRPEELPALWRAANVILIFWEVLVLGFGPLVAAASSGPRGFGEAVMAFLFSLAPAGLAFALLEVCRAVLYNAAWVRNSLFELRSLSKAVTETAFAGYKELDDSGEAGREAGD